MLVFPGVRGDCFYIMADVCTVFNPTVLYQEFFMFDMLTFLSMVDLTKFYSWSEDISDYGCLTPMDHHGSLLLYPFINQVQSTLQMVSRM